MDSRPVIKVLIADDETAIRNGLYTAVSWEELDMSVTGSVRDGQEAWELINSARPDIIITDIRMPRLSGLDLIKLCRDHGLPCQFIILSGYDDFSYAQTAIRYGAKAYILKPLNIDELTDILKSLKTELDKTNRDRLPDPSVYQTLQTSSKKLFLNQLIHNEFRYVSDIHKRMEDFPHRLSEKAYLVAVFSVTPEDAARIPSLSETVARSSLNVLKPLLGEVWDSSSDQIVAILYLPDSDGSSAVKKRIHSLLSRLRQDLGIRISAGIGSSETELIHVSRSYANALNALSYQIYETNQDIYDESVICQLPPVLSSNGIHTENLIDAIQKGDKETIVRYCQDFFHSLLYVPMPPPSYIRGMSIYLVTDVQNSLRKQITEDIGLFSDIPYKNINRFITLHQIEEWVTGLLIEYSDLLSQYFQNHKNEVITSAKQYIHNHMNKKIQAEDVAAHVNLSTSYFTIYFKAKTGINFRDYVLKVKIEEAKRLLKTSGDNISQVAYAVGYDDYRSFYRAFKNYTGLTPSEYQTSET